MKINNYLCFLNFNESLFKMFVLLISLTCITLIFLGLFYLKDRMIKTLSLFKQILMKLDEKLAYILINRFNDNVKVFIVKTMIFFNVILLFVLIYLSVLCDVFNKKEFEKITLIMGFFNMFSVFLQFYLMGRAKVDNKSTPPIVMKHNIKNYEEFKEDIIRSLQENNYNTADRVDIKDNESEATIIINTMKNETLVVQMIWMEDYNDEIVEEYTNTFYLEVMKRVGEKVIEKHYVKLIQYVCVQRQNTKFKKFVSNELEQDFLKSQIITGISIGGKKAYVSRTSLGFFIKDYNKMKSISDLLTKDILIEIKDINKEIES